VVRRRAARGTGQNCQEVVSFPPGGQPLAAGPQFATWLSVLFRDDVEYRPFPQVNTRDDVQELIEVPLLVDLLGLEEPGSVLEVGCGPGVSLLPLYDCCRPTRLLGLDLDPALCRQARARLRAAELPTARADVLCGDVRRLPFPDGCFDLVLDFGTAYHIARRGDALRELARVLRPGGRLVHETPFNQLVAHPVRSFGRRLPWEVVPALRPQRGTLNWGLRVKA
jgi:SAM-dependent methyltransferase